METPQDIDMIMQTIPLILGLIYLYRVLPVFAHPANFSTRSVVKHGLFATATLLFELQMFSVIIFGEFISINLWAFINLFAIVGMHITLSASKKHEIQNAKKEEGCN